MPVRPLPPFGDDVGDDRDRGVAVGVQAVVVRSGRQELQDLADGVELGLATDPVAHEVPASRVRR